MEEWQKEQIDNNLTELAKETTCSQEFLQMFASRNLLGSGHVAKLRSPGMTAIDKSKNLYKHLAQRPGSFDVLIRSLEETKQTKALKILLDSSTIFPNNGAIDYDKNKVLRQGCLIGDMIYKGTFNMNRRTRDAAVKVMNADVTETRLALREVEMLTTLQGHKNIVWYFAEEAREDAIYIALELFKNTLQDEIKLNVVNLDGIRILKECTEGVAYLHLKNVIHTNLNPTSVLLKEDGQVKLCNFGLAEKITSGKENVTVRLESVRDRHWMARELLIEEASAASDVFSLGCIFFFVLKKGVHPFGNPDDRKRNILQGTPELKKSALDPLWLELIKKMISKTISDRPSAKEVLLDQAFTTENATCSSSHSGLRPSPNLGVSMTLPASSFSDSSDVLSTQLASDSETANNTASPLVLENIPPAPTTLKRSLPSKPNRPIPCSSSTAKKQKIGVRTQTEESQEVDQLGNNKIFRAVLERKDLQELKRIVDSGAVVNRVNNAGESILHLAVRHHDPEVVKLLISAGADVNAKDKAGDLPIHKLRDEGCFKEKLMVLCQNGADINAENADGNTILTLAASAGRPKDDIEFVISKSGDWKRRNKNDQTILHLAVEGGNCEVIKLLIKTGIKIDAAGKNESAPIHQIAYTKQNFNTTLDTLLTHGASINAQDKDGDTVLAWAAAAGRSREDLEYIIENGGDWKAKNEKGQSILHAAAEGGDPEVLRFLIKCGADVNLKDGNEELPLHQLPLTKKDFQGSLDVLLENQPATVINAKNHYGNRLLNLSVFLGRPRADLEYIVAKGGEVKLKNNDGKCVLHCAVEGGNIEGVEYFISLGVAINSKDKLGQLPLHYLVDNMKNFKETLDFVLENGGAVNATRRCGENLLMLAAQKGRTTDILDYIIQKGGDEKKKNRSNQSILHLCAMGGNEEALKYFIARGAQVNVMDLNGSLPMHFIAYAKENFKECVNLFLELGFNVNATNDIGDTLLLLAVYRGKTTEIIEYLIQKGADWTMKNVLGQSVTHFSALGTNVEALRYFIPRGASVNERDNNGDFPMHLLAYAEEDKNLKECVNVLLEHGATINAKNKKGLTLLDLAVMEKRD